MPKQERRPLGDGAVLLGGERPVPTKAHSLPQPTAALDASQTKAHHSSLRSRLAAAADYAEDVCARALSPCSRDLAWWMCRIANRYADNAYAPLEQLERELLRVERLWRACMEVEFLESGQWPVEAGL